MASPSRDTGHTADAADFPDQEPDFREKYDPRVDPEARLLCAVLWLTKPVTGVVAKILEFIHPSDFRLPAHERLWRQIIDQYQQGQPTEASLIVGRLTAAGAEGLSDWPDGVSPAVYVSDIISLGAFPEQIPWLAEQTMNASYRRQFQSMTTFLTQCGREANVEDLWPLMEAQGRRQRTARTRLEAFRREIFGTGEDNDTAIIEGTIVEDADEQVAASSAHEITASATTTDTESPESKEN